MQNVYPIQVISDRNKAFKIFSDFVTTDEITLSLDFQMLKIQTRTFVGIGSSNWNKKKLEDTVESF
jgi:hypothetical protein